jgi:hypothetical protein
VTFSYENLITNTRKTNHMILLGKTYLFLIRGPWHFENHMLLFHEVKKEMCSTRYDANNDDGCWRTYIRICMRLDARIPIMKELKVKKQGGECYG